MATTGAIRTLKDLLDHEERFSSGSNVLGDVIGDGYFLARIPIYRILRGEALTLGFRFSHRPGFPYWTFPLLYLPKILESKIIPYNRNRLPLAQLSHAQQIQMNFRDFAEMRPSPNYIFHETAHCVAHAYLARHPKRRTRASRRRDIIEVMIGESFANAAEAMAVHSLSPNPTNRWFFAMNLYVDQPLPAYRSLVKKIGTRAAFHYWLLAFLYSNFLYTAITPKQRRLMLKTCGLGVGLVRDRLTRRNLKELETRAFQLNPSFRIFTTAAYLKLRGHKSSAAKSLDFDPVEFLENDPTLSLAILNLVELVTRF